MKELTEKRRKIYRQLMEERFQSQLKELDVVELERVNEIFKIIALGATFQKPRTFKGETVTAQDFQDMAAHIPFETICAAVDAMEIAERKRIPNIPFYMMGMLLRSGRVVVSRRRKTELHNDRGYDERQYTSEELNSIARSIDSLSEDDI